MKNLLILISIALAGCGGRKKYLKVSGSDTMIEMVKELAQAYMKEYSNKSVAVRGGGSGTGIASLFKGSSDIANASRKMKEAEWKAAEEKGFNIKEHVVALDGVAVIVNPENKVDKLSLEQLRSIYIGKVKNWKEVGGANLPIAVISRENNSGTHVYFKNKVLRRGNKKGTEEFGSEVSYSVSSQDAIDQVSKNKYAIAYLGMGWVSEKTKALKLGDGKVYYEPNKENVLNEKYPLARGLQMYVNLTDKKESEDQLPAEHFIEFIMSKEGQKIVEEVKFVSVKN